MNTIAGNGTIGIGWWILTIVEGILLFLVGLVMTRLILRPNSEGGTVTGHRLALILIYLMVLSAFLGCLVAYRFFTPGVISPIGWILLLLGSLVFWALVGISFFLSLRLRSIGIELAGRIIGIADRDQVEPKDQDMLGENR